MNPRAGPVWCGVLLTMLALGACAPKLPTHPWTGAPEALAILAARADSIGTFASPATIHLKRRDGYTVSLDGAVAARIPGWLRIRAWKFGNAVMDVTVTPDGVWVLRQYDDVGAAPPPATGPDRLAEVWTLFTGRFFDDPGATVIDAGGRRFQVQRPLDDGGGIVACELDRATLTARSWVITDDRGLTRLTLTLERYRMIGATPWPMRLTAEMAPPPDDTENRSGDAARVTITFDEAEVNPELADGAFVPPRRAVKRP